MLWNLVNVPVQYGLVGIWDDLSPEWKILLLAHHRAAGTMHAYEDLVSQGKI